MKFILGALIAFTIIVLQEFIPLTSIDIFEQISAYLLVMSIPLLSYLYVMAYVEDNKKTASVWTGYKLIAPFIIILDLLGLTFAFLHMSIIIGALFFSSAIISLALWIYSMNYKQTK